MTNVDDELRDAEMKRFYEDTCTVTNVRQIDGHCAKCGKQLFSLVGDWETWMYSDPIFCLDCYREAMSCPTK